MKKKFLLNDAVSAGEQLNCNIKWTLLLGQP